MWRRIVSALLVFGWISLSGFDVVEDLDEVPGQVALSTAPDDIGFGSKRGGWGPLANNMIESASRTKPVKFAPVTFSHTIFQVSQVLTFRKHSQLHKLYRVFLI